MEELTAIYLGLILAGILWVVWRLARYMRFQRMSESRWDDAAMADEQFRQYLETLRQQRTEQHGSSVKGKSEACSGNS
jgi:hypothetical protein